MQDPKNISIKDYTYHLPEEKIALVPLAERDASKLLIWKNGIIAEDRYKNIANHIPEKSLLVFNNSKVIHARIRFKKSSGAGIEIFCLEPHGVMTEYQTVMHHTSPVQWKCFIGGAAKWKEPFLEKIVTLGDQTCVLKAKLVEKITDAYLIEFSWHPTECRFAEVLEAAGDIPLPPYIKRETTINDENRYQTIFAENEGSVAAPTAGLHFTPSIFKNFAKKNIETAYLTLHVGAGTFKPVKADTMETHEMHAEWIDVHRDTIQQLATSTQLIVAIGTTALRTLETLYWLGVKAFIHPNAEKLELNQWDIVEQPLVNTILTKNDALQALLNWLQAKRMERLFTQTRLLITPGYNFKIAKALVTNFHQPQSTLLLLVAATVGTEWKSIYTYALKNDFRFLSYGDGNLLFMAGS